MSEQSAASIASADSPGSLIPLLQEIQQDQGYLPKHELQHLAYRIGIPLSKIYGVATFYTQFRFSPLGKYVVNICRGTACHVNGALGLYEHISGVLGLQEGETTPDGLITLERVACVGCCSLAPVMTINGRIFAKLNQKKVTKIIDQLQRDNLND